MLKPFFSFIVCFSHIGIHLHNPMLINKYYLSMCQHLIVYNKNNNTNINFNLYNLLTTLILGYIWVS